MGIKFKITVLMISILAISGCSSNSAQPVDEADHSAMNKEDMEEMSHSAMNHDKMRNEHMSHDEVISLNDSTGENELKIPPMLERDKGEGVEYTVRAQKGKTEIFDGIETNTYGYNGAFLGPVLRFSKGDTVKIRTINELDEETTFHWHGLEVPGDADGGPHDSLKPGEEKLIGFKVKQEASTLWFHPHPKGKTAEQVYNGLAGLIYIDDDHSKSLGLPNEYGKNDIPLIFQIEHSMKKDN